MTPTNLAQDAAQRLLASYWGKADPAMALLGVDHHTVLGHSLDVAACAHVLAEHNLGLRALFASSTGLSAREVAPTFAAVCALHDIGKLDTRFQRKAPAVADALRPQSAAIERGSYDHGTEGFRQIEDDEASSQLAHALLGPGALPLLRAVCGHHGSLPTRDEPDATPGCFPRTRLPRALRSEDAEARRLFLDGVAGFFVSLGARLPWPTEVDGPLVQRLAGLCAVADWLGSSVEHFPYCPGPIRDLDDYWARACERAAAACSQAGLVRAVPTGPDFARLFPGYSPRDVQLLTEKALVDGPALTIVEAEMGKGKTEAALSLAARFLAMGLGEGLTVALPTMATSNAMFGRIEEVAPRMFGHHVQLALAHGRASRQPRVQALVQRGLHARDEDNPEASVSCARWLLNRKRVLLAQIGVGTIDQALQAALTVRHHFVRMFGLSRNVVIIDEVHAYDAYMEVLLEHLLQWLGALRVPVILLSATLPSDRRAALCRAWRGEQAQGRVTASDPVAADDLDAARSLPYPLVTITTRTGTTTLSSDHAAPARSLLVERSPGADDSAEIRSVASRLLVAARSGARVVWVRNTVREAQQAYAAVAALAAGVEHTLFHARFRGCDRSRVEQHVLDRYGKSAPPGGRVLVATQVVEQSLDLDFDEMHSDLAPIDLLFQRAGRLHRHARARCPDFERPRLVVHGPWGTSLAALRFGPSRFVYDAGTLWLTARALESREELHLPTDIRPLVEEVYHPASRAALLSMGGAQLVALEQAREGVLEARRTRARQCCIPPTSADPDGGAVMDDDDDAVQAFTRDGMSATLLPFWWAEDGARVLDAAAGSPVWALDSARGDAWRLASDLLDQTLSLPARGDVEGMVAPADDAAWACWRREFARFADESGLGRRLVPVPMRRDPAVPETARGWLRMGGKLRRVLYSPTLGFLMPSEKDEELAR